MTGLAPSLTWLFVARAPSGVDGATAGVANAYFADVTTAGNRARHFGLAGAAWTTGLILGPALGGVSGQSDQQLPLAVAAALATMNFLHGLFVRPESCVRADKPLALSCAFPLGATRVLGAAQAFPVSPWSPSV